MTRLLLLVFGFTGVVFSQTPTLIEVAHGLSAGDLVMIGSRTQVQPGQKVEPKLSELAEAAR